MLNVKNDKAKQKYLKFNERRNKSGVVFLRRIPPFFSYKLLRNILCQYGEIGRIYLEPENENIFKKRKKYKKNRRKNYIYGWVEFMDKNIANNVAISLNNTKIGGPRRSRYREDLWCIQFLEDFKWNDISEQNAHERNVREVKIREATITTELENRFYFRNKYLSKKIEKKEASMDRKKLTFVQKKGKIEKIDENRHINSLATALFGDK